MPRPALDAVDGLAQLTFVVHGLLERRFAQHGVSVVLGRLLGILRDRTPTMADIGRRLELDKSSVTGLIDRAERRGLVARVRSDEDRRSVRVALTDDGRRLAAIGESGFTADVTALLDVLPASDRDALAALVSRLLVAHADVHGIDLFA